MFQKRRHFYVGVFAAVGCYFGLRSLVNFQQTGVGPDRTLLIETLVYGAIMFIVFAVVAYGQGLLDKSSDKKKSASDKPSDKLF